jgi:hypothetical protein
MCVEVSADAVLLKAVSRIADRWRLDEGQVGALVHLPASQFDAAAAGKQFGRLDEDQRLRVGLLVGIFASLSGLFEGSLAHEWPTSPNNSPVFGGATPLSHMILGGVDAMVQTRDYLESVRVGG